MCDDCFKMDVFHNCVSDEMFFWHFELLSRAVLDSHAFYTELQNRGSSYFSFLKHEKSKNSFFRFQSCTFNTF